MAPASDLAAGLEREIHVWRIPLAASAEPDAATLAAEEAERAARLVFPADRARFLAAHGGLRGILAGCLDRRAEDLRFAFGHNGKPYLPGAPLYFNLSHSHDWALVAVTRVAEVGADIERIRPVEPRLAQRFFAPAEAAALARTPEAERAAAFFRCWTRKEAFLKALGEGLARPLNDFEVEFAAEAPPGLRRVAGDAEEAGRWQFAHLDPAPGYVAAVAARALGWRLRDRGEWRG